MTECEGITIAPVRSQFRIVLISGNPLGKNALEL